MNQTTIPVSGPLTIVIENISGDLQVAGWDHGEITAKTDGDAAELRVEDRIVYVHAEGDLALYLPREVSVQTANVSGDADIRAVAGNILMGNVGGDLQMRAVGTVALQSVGGDLSVRGCSGDFIAESVGSDALVRDLQGDLKISTVGSDLCLRNLSGSIHALTGADAILYLQPVSTAKIYIQAGSDILLHLPAQIDAELTLQGGSMDSVRVDFAGFEPAGIGPVQTVRVGSGAAKIGLMAGGDLIVTGPSDADGPQPQTDFASEGSGEMPPPPGRFPAGMGDFANFGDHLAQNIQNAVQNAQRHRERAERRVEAAMRRAEEKMRASERRANFVGVAVGRGSVGRPPAPMVPPPPPPVPANEPVSDVERLAVLRMLQEKKISLEEAEKLLTALEGK